MGGRGGKRGAEGGDGKRQAGQHQKGDQSSFCLVGLVCSATRLQLGANTGLAWVHLRTVSHTGHKSGDHRIFILNGEAFSS